MPDLAGVVTHGLRREFRVKDGPARVAVLGLDLQVRPGELVCLLGPNGAGKTTVVRMLAGMLSPTAGSAVVGGFDVVSQRRGAALATGSSLGGDLGLYPRLTALQNLTFAGLMYGMRGAALAARATVLLGQVGLADRAAEPVRTFSRGMKQRLHLARALVHDPAVLILDEPSAGLDPQSAAAMRDLVATLSADGRCVLLTTHDMREAEALSDRVILLKDGAVYAEATPAELRVQAAGRLGHMIEIVWAQAENGQDCADCPGVLEATADRGVTRLRVRDGAAAVQWLLATFGALAASVSVTPPTLEQVFLEMARAS